MGKHVKLYEVTSLNRVDTSKYVEGTLFKTSRSLGILIDGVIKPLQTEPINLKDYVKKSDVEKMINDKLGGKKNE